MSGPLVQVVPNFSEGRRQDVMDAIVEALQVPGVLLLNRQSDPDHNRLDTTLIGPPEAVRRSALAGAAKAVELIDMEQHTGSHPRMGAVDVIPFVPVRDITMEETVELARDFARELAETLSLPVYVYDRAALSPDRASLAEVRKGQFEGLKADVASGQRLPDFGPHELGRAGAVAVGARKPLIAFNVYLTGGDEDAAKEIAKTIRESSGGMPAVRAVGFDVPERGAVTVSMNLVDYETTAPHVALDAIRAEAAARGMTVRDTEIVGLVPQQALFEAALAHLQLEGFDPAEQVLELLVARAGSSEAPPGVEAFADALASSDPTPGGGSAAAAVGAFGAALIGMVARLTIGRKGFEAVETRMATTAATADVERAALLELATRDAAAYDAVMAAFKLPKETDEEKATRKQAIRDATVGAADVPLEVAERTAALIPLAREVTADGNPNAASDGYSAGHLLHAAFRAAWANVQINLAGLAEDDPDRRRMAEALEPLSARASRSLDEVSAAFEAAIG
jgi:glutamate formiminotransferase/formiminotetrahydrofolate cyclodeaminase